MFKSSCLSGSCSGCAAVAFAFPLDPPMVGGSFLLRFPMQVNKKNEYMCVCVCCECANGEEVRTELCLSLRLRDWHVLTEAVLIMRTALMVMVRVSLSRLS